MVLSIFGLVMARAEAEPLSAQYAQALRAFNPRLNVADSQMLASRALAEADGQRLDARLLVALIAVESAWRPEARSSAGAVGLAQLMPQTAAGLRVDPADPLENIHGAAVHLRGLLDRYRDRDPVARYALALAAYNAGSGAVYRYGGIPPYPETRAYVSRVILLWRRLAGEP